MQAICSSTMRCLQALSVQSLAAASGRCLSASASASASSQTKPNHYRVVVAGGGCGGCSVANRLVSKLGADSVCVVEPSDTHYYQPMWTLVGSGIKEMSQSAEKMSNLLPDGANWIKQYVSDIDPKQQLVSLSDGQKLSYDYLVVAVGVRLLYERIDGALAALKEDPAVCSNYHPEFVLKTYPAFDLVKSGNAIFTFPNGPIKCPGAPQKIMYLFEDSMRQRGLRDNINIMYNTSLPVVFGVKKYAAELMKVCSSRNISINFRHNLVSVDHNRRTALFENLDTQEKKEMDYSLLHIAPPVGPHEFMQNSPLSLDGTGWVSVSKDSLQHSKFDNVFALGDCSNVPTSKTAAAVASQSTIVAANLLEVIEGRQPNKETYDGYTSCPLLTSYNSVIMAEFDYNAQPLETFPIDQGQQRYSMYIMKAHMLPQMYWHGLVKGRWAGPKPMRKFFDLFRRSAPTP